MLNIEVSINVYFWVQRFFAGISIRSDLCIVGCSVYILYSDKILESRNEKKSEKYMDSIEEVQKEGFITHLFEKTFSSR